MWVSLPALSAQLSPIRLGMLALVAGCTLWSSASLAIGEKLMDQLISSDFTQLNLGIVFEQRLSELFWDEFSLGYAGLGRLSVDSDQDSELETNLESSPYFRIGITVRPF